MANDTEICISQVKNTSGATPVVPSGITVLQSQLQQKRQTTVEDCFMVLVTMTLIILSQNFPDHYQGRLDMQWGLLEDGLKLQFL